MRVTFECEDCGYVETPTVITTDERGCVSIEQLTERPCPNCAKLRYGPLTVEMVAEALETICDDANSGHSEWVDMARFVLRLMHAVGEHKGLLPAVDGDFPESYRDWLLDLARGK